MTYPFTEMSLASGRSVTYGNGAEDTILAKVPEWMLCLVLLHPT